jgi:hypothetical protein
MTRPERAIGAPWWAERNRLLALGRHANGPRVLARRELLESGEW